MPLFGSGFEPKKKLKPNLKMAVRRIAMINNKKKNTVAQHKRKIIDLLKTRKYDKANIHIEHVIREDRLMEVYEIVSLMCELLTERLTLIVQDKVCPADLLASIQTLIWTQPRLQVPELNIVTKQFSAKYGKEFIRRARQNADGFVDVKIMNRLSIQPPGREEREAYIKDLCTMGEIAFDESMLVGSTLTGVFDQDNRVGSKIAETPAGLPTFPAYNPAAAAAAAAAGGAPRGPPGGPARPGGPAGPGGMPPGGYGGGYGGYGGGGGGGMALPRAPAAAPANVYRVGDPATGTAGPWVGGMPAAAAAAPGGGAVPTFPMPPAAAGEYGRQAFSAAMGAAGGPGTLPAGVNPSVPPSYAPPAPTFAAPSPAMDAKAAAAAAAAASAAAAGLAPPASAPAPAAAPARPPVQSTIPDFDELSARFAALRDA